jgi:hypothetical protein
MRPLKTYWHHALFHEYILEGKRTVPIRKPQQIIIQDK